MKKLLLTLLAATGLLAAQAAGPTYTWSKLIDSPQSSDQVRDIAATSDGNIVTIGNFGSRTATDNISFDGEVIATGAATESSSDNLNLLIMKQNAADGKKMWAVSSKKGDISTMGCVVITATPDGGVIALLCFRSSKTTPYENPMLVDASGAEVEFLDWNLSEWIKYQTLVKISKDGIIEWTRPIIADQLPVPNASGNYANVTTDAGLPGAVLTDADGNIYIGGNFRAPLMFTGAQNSAFILTARNLEAYSGDTQGFAGGFYLVKLDKDGNYLTHLQSASTDLTGDQIYDMQLSGDKIFFAGKLEGADKGTLTIGPKATGITLTKKSANGSLMLGAVEAATLKPVFLTCYDKVPTTTSNAGTIKFMKMAVSGNNVYLMGALNKAGIAANGSAEAFISVPSNITLQRAFIAKVSATDGTAAGGYMPNDLTGISEFENAFEYDGKLYAAGYLMNAGTGSFIDEINPADFSLSQRTIIAKGGGAPTLTCAHFNADKKILITASRGSNAFTVDGDKTTDKPQSWGSVIVCHSFADASGVNDIDADNNGLTITTEDGAVVINATEKTDISVVDMQGRQVDRQTVNAGETRISLAPGFYLVNNQKVAVK